MLQDSVQLIDTVFIELRQFVIGDIQFNPSCLVIVGKSDQILYSGCESIWNTTEGNYHNQNQYVDSV